MANPEESIDHEVQAESLRTINQWFGDLPFSDWDKLFDDHIPREIRDRSITVTADIPELPELRINQYMIRDAYSHSDDVDMSIWFMSGGNGTLWQFLVHGIPSWRHGYKDRDLPVEISKIIAPEIESELVKLRQSGQAGKGWLGRMAMPAGVDRDIARSAAISVQELRRRRLVEYKNELETEAIFKLYKERVKTVVPEY